MTVLIRNKQQLIRNCKSRPNRRARSLCLQALEKGLDAVDAYRCVRARIKGQGRAIVIDNVPISIPMFSRVMLLAVGKASVPMMKAATDALRGFRIHGICVIPKGRRPSLHDDRIETICAGHPIPDAGGLRASQRALGLVRMLRNTDLLICLVSGGASSMLPAPSRGISLGDKKRVTEELLRSRATIHEINTVRRHLSEIKGGRLVENCRAEVFSLIVSDVPENFLPDIASGPTVEDPTTYLDAIDVLRHHNLWNQVPSNVRRHLTLGLRGEISETPKPGNVSFRKVRNIVIADNRTACEAVKNRLDEGKCTTTILTSSAEMEAQTMGRLLASIGTETKKASNASPQPQGVIIGGETTVKILGRGIGGRNQEAALAASEKIAGLNGVVIVALGTDGVDGNSTAAGALVDGETAYRSKRRHLNASDFLLRNDSFSYFKKLNDNIFTGPTGTNVSDLYITLSIGDS